MFEEPGELGDFSRFQFRYVDFWVQVHNILLVCMSERMALYIGKMIREVWKLDGGATSLCLGKFLRIRVRLDVKKPLRKAVNVIARKNKPPLTLFII